jgi:hypothetical protein
MLTIPENIIVNIADRLSKEVQSQYPHVDYLHTTVKLIALDIITSVIRETNDKQVA